MSTLLGKLLKFWQKQAAPLLENAPRLLVSVAALEFISRSSSQSPNFETGGILIGHHSGSDIIVRKATDAGPNAKRSQCGFLRDRSHCQKILEQEFAVSGADYVGEWHTHVIDLPRPSSGDLQTLAGIILDPDYDFPSFCMILAVVGGESPRIAGYVVTAYSCTRRPARKTVKVVETELTRLEKDADSRAL